MIGATLHPIAPPAEALQVERSAGYGAPIVFLPFFDLVEALAAVIQQTAQTIAERLAYVGGKLLPPDFSQQRQRLLS